MNHPSIRTVAAVAGRRIDAPGAMPARFPTDAEFTVRSVLKQVLAERGVSTLVASAACGADILALEVAAELGIRCEIVLPFDRKRFRSTSVVDRGEEWGQRYDRVVARADASGKVTVITEATANDDDAYAIVTRRLISDCLALATESMATPIAIAIWDQQPRDSGDATKDFIDRAIGAGIEVIHVSTVLGH